MSSISLCWSLENLNIELRLLIPQYSQALLIILCNLGICDSVSYESFTNNYRYLMIYVQNYINYAVYV